MTATSQPTALVTGASRGLGRALVRTLTDRGWRVVFDARTAADLGTVATGLPAGVAVPGSVTDPVHRAELVDALDGRLDLLVNNASDLGPSPLPPLADHSLERLRDVYETNVLAPLALVQLALPLLRESNGIIVNVSSDAAVEPYAGWGGYGSSKAALDHLSAILGVEENAVRVYAVDPGDMRTAMHQAAFPGEDISDRPEPEEVVPALVRLIDTRPESGRYRLAELAVTS